MTKTLIILGLLLFGLIDKKAKACSCIGESTVQAAYKSANLVMTGRVISQETVWIPYSTRIKNMLKLGYRSDELDKRLYGRHLTKVIIKVDTIYKAKSIKDTLTIYTGLGGGDCGFSFKVGQKYIIYGDTQNYLSDYSNTGKLRDGQGNYWTNICMRTQLYNQNEIEKLEKLKHNNGSQHELCIKTNKKPPFYCKVEQ